MEASAASAGNRVLVVMPAFNEEQSLPAVLADVRLALPDADILVVDDGSTDGTARAARGHAVVARLPFNVGVGGAVRTGFRYAAELGVTGFPTLLAVDGDRAIAVARGHATADDVDRRLASLTA